MNHTPGITQALSALRASGCDADADRIESALSASAEPVATVCLRGDRYASENMIEVQLQIAPGAELPIGTKLYAHAPAVQAESSGFCWDTVVQVVDALTRLGVSTPESPSEQAAHVESMVLTLCHEAKSRPFSPPPASVPDDGINAAIVEARAHHFGVWPEDLTSGVMFFKGYRITRDRFNHSKIATTEPK